MDEGESTRTGTRTKKNGIANGRCVWEKRMKCDQVKGGIKLFKGEEEEICNDFLISNDEKITVDEEEVAHVVDKKKQKVIIVGTTNGSGKRKTWKNSESLVGSPIQLANQRSEMGVKNPLEEKTPIQNRKTRSESMNVSLEKSPIQNKKSTRSELRKTKSDSPPQQQLIKAKSQENGESCCNELINGGVVDEKIDKGIAGIKNCKEFAVGEEEKVTTTSNEEIKEDNKGIIEEDNKVAVKEITYVAEEKKKFQTIPTIVKKKTPPFVTHTKIHLPTPSKTNPGSDETQTIPRKHTKLQSFIELVMWRDVSRSAFVFGLGTFGIISSSYTKDLNISFISVISYLGLVYLAAIFLSRSFISRGCEMNDSSMKYVFGEEEAVWLVKLTLPYVNECFLNLKALFSGDPATTMKMAVMLFVLARFGSSITIWKMAKLSFFGVFIVPKICSSYSTQFTEYGISWMGRFRDAWESCTHKKAVAFAIFTLVWKWSSSPVRIWAVFMLFVAFRYYQQSIYTRREGWVKEEPKFEDSLQTSRVGPAQRQPRRPILVETEKQRKIY